MTDSQIRDFQQQVEPANERLRLGLLVGQSSFLGASLGLLVVVAYTLFLVDFGSKVLPYAYIGIAVFVSMFFYGFAELLKRWTLSKVFIIAVASFTAMFFLTRLALVLPNSQWVSFVLVIAFALGIQIAFIVVGGQAGRLFDVRQMKRLFPLVVAGLGLGFTTGGLLVSPLLSLLGTTENLLLVGGGTMLVSLSFLVTTTRRFPTIFARAEAKTSKQQAKPLSQLLRKRYIALIFLYQMLSAMGTQLVEFIFYNQSEARFVGAEALAQFFGSFAVALNVTSLMFVTFVAGYLLSRFGLRFGLAANPIVVGTIMMIMAVVSALFGSGGLLFWLAAGVRILDIVLSNGATSTSIKATYQALPDDERPTVETAVEGIGVPVAFGITGVILLIFNSISWLTIIHIIFFTFITTMFWTAAGVLVYRNYAGALLRTLSRRMLDDVQLLLTDKSSLAVVEKLVSSDKISQVRLGLDMLEEAEHESLEPHLTNLLAHPVAEIRAESLARAERRKLNTFLPLLQASLADETNPAVKGAAVRTLCALQEPVALETVTPYLDDPAAEVRLGAMVGLLRYGGIPGVLAAGERLQNLEHAPDPANRQLIAEVIGQVGIDNFYQPLIPLLKDDDLSVRHIALIAAGQVNHPRLLPSVIDNLCHRQLRSAAMAALVAAGETVLPLVAPALAGETDYDEETVIRLVRVCSDIQGEAVIQLLKKHLNHPDDDVQVQVLMTLERCGYRATAGDMAEIEHTLRGEVEHGLRVLLAQQDIGQNEALTHLHRTLEYELEQARRRVFLLLSFVYDSAAILRAEEQLAWGDKGQKALALETLDVTLTGQQKSLLFPLVDDGQRLEQRTRQLTKLFELKNASQRERLCEIIANSNGVWTHGWTRACAIYAAGKLGLTELVASIESAQNQIEHPIPETAVWALDILRQ